MKNIFKKSFTKILTLSALSLVSIQALAGDIKGQVDSAVKGPNNTLIVSGWACETGNKNPPKVYLGHQGAYRDNKDIKHFHAFKPEKTYYYNNQNPIALNQDSTDLYATCGIVLTAAEPRLKFRFLVTVSEAELKAAQSDQQTMFIQAYYSGSRTATLVRGDYLPRNPYGSISAAVDSIQQVMRTTYNSKGQLTTTNGDVRMFGHLCYVDWNPFHPYPIVRIKNNVTHLYETLVKDVDYGFNPGQPVDIGDGKGNWWCRNNGHAGAGFELRLYPGKFMLDPKDPKKPNLNYAGAPISLTFSGNNNGLPVGAGGQLKMYLPTTDRF